MRKLLAISALVALLSCSALADPRGPSTPQERDRALQVIDQLEKNPLSPALKADRDWIFQWVKEVPDVDARMCMAIIGPLVKEKNTPERNAMTLQNMLASAAFVIRHPEKSSDTAAVYLAGTEGMLRAYENMVNQDPSKKNQFLDGLRGKQNEGTLEAYVKKGSAQCLRHPGTVLAP